MQYTSYKFYKDNYQCWIFLIDFLNLSKNQCFCKCLGVYPKLLALDRKDFQFSDILILLKVEDTESFVLDFTMIIPYFETFVHMGFKTFSYLVTFQ